MVLVIEVLNVSSLVLCFFFSSSEVIKNAFYLVKSRPFSQHVFPCPLSFLANNQLMDHLGIKKFKKKKEGKVQKDPMTADHKLVFSLTKPIKFVLLCQCWLDILLRGMKK